MRGTAFSFTETAEFEPEPESSGLIEAVVGPCADVQVAPAARPKVLVRGSVHSAVRNAQVRLNAYHAAEVAAGRAGLPGAPLREDCLFGGGTFGAVLEFQKQVFPGVLAEHDGRIGSHTWTKLDAVSGGPPVVVPPVVAPPSPPSPPLATPVALGRPCCLLASGSLRGASGPLTFGDHGNGNPGTVYTGKAGFLDFGHLWDTADLTGWAYQKIQAASGAAGTKIPLVEGKAELTSAAPLGEWLMLARSIAYDDALAHEIITYGIGQCGDLIPLPGAHNSAFSPEDLCSNYLGTLVAERALLAGGPFVTELESQVAALLTALDAQSVSETRKAFDLIKLRWVDASPGTATNCYLKRRNFTSMPWKAGHSSDAPTPAFVTAPFSLTATYDYESNTGFKRTDFTAQIAAIEAHALGLYGPDYKTP